MPSGSDTVNSLRSPASSNNLFTLRPTRGLISRTGIIPLSFTQDAIGAMTRTVSDLAKAFTVMSSIGYDPADNVTALIPSTSIGVDYSKYLYGHSLKGMRFGLLNGFFNYTATNETTPVNNVMANMVKALTKAGATVIPINSTLYDASALSASLDVQSYEFRQAMDIYLSSVGGTHPSSLADLYHNSGGKFLVVPSQYAFINRSLALSPSNPNYAIGKLGIANLTTAVLMDFTSLKLDALIYPEQKNLVVKIGAPGQSGRNGILAALTGSPVVVVPAGFSPPTPDAPIGVPVGMEIMGLPWSEAKLFSIAAEIEKIAHWRKMPAFANMSVQAGQGGYNGSVTTVPKITPNRGNISPAYPVGVL
jgi:Asp-tRNA(Asn)/Glu-tRNA(Gln) amidotransferase A subunit family amidase